MAHDDSELGFEIRDRRHRAEEDRSAPAQGRKQATAGRSAAPPPTAGAPSAPQERSLVGLFMMLGSLALAGLEGVQDPSTGQTERDPAHAAEVIDTLMLLRDKTEGHLTAEESRVLEELIYDLQIRYVRASRP